ncbi:MAG: sodium-translocating pyrophosphatase [Candidatus Omnitrophica bacterium]|nr:sodium-translocating pyrophosphatase [Candidatus Omnitrophota bacterium]
MSEHAIVLPKLGPVEIGLLWFVLASALIGLLYGAFLAWKVLKESRGSREMIEVQQAIQEGARGYLFRQFSVMSVIVVVVAIGLFFIYKPLYPTLPHIPWGVAIAFLAGCIASAGAGYVGMHLAVRANARVANAALSSFKKALEIAFQAGTVSGMFTVGLGLMGATLIFLIFGENAMKVLIGFGFGGCLVALFMRVGGGNYTKAADVGADLVGKVEKNIPEDDPRNAAVIADNVGDNVGDCAGMAADVFESYEVTLVAAIILGAATLLDPTFVAMYGGMAAASAMALKLIIYPLLVRAAGVFASIIGTWSVRGEDKEDFNPMWPINVGFWVAAGISTVGFFIVNLLYLHGPDGKTDFRFFFATLVGIILALVISHLTEYFTAVDKKPVEEVAYSAKTGPATMLLSGFSLGLESSVWSIVAIALTIISSFLIFHGNLALSAYGVALSGLGLLTTTGFILAMDTYGPISDNANGVFEMSGALKEEDKHKNVKASRIVAKLDAVGNTTKALTKGFAIATAVIAAVSLFRSYVEEAGLVETGIQINFPEVFIGLLIGGAVPFLFSSFAIRAVGRSAFMVVEEVRRQFREIPGLMEGKAKPEYFRCVNIVTAAAQKELLAPAILAICTPVLVAFALGYAQPLQGAAALGGYLAGAILSGQLMAVFLSNAGGAWDNAKKRIEEGLLGGKGTEAHKAGVICDTVGDPFKDTAGPALNPLIKVMNLVAILIAPIAIKDISVEVRTLIVVVMLLALGIAVYMSKREIAYEVGITKK